MTAQAAPPARRKPAGPRFVDVRVRFTWQVAAAATISVEETELADLERVKQYAIQDLHDGALSQRLEQEMGGAEVELVYRLDARCKLREPNAATPWCRIHDDPMRRDDPKRCYGAPHDAKPSGYAR